MSQLPFNKWVAETIRKNTGNVKVRTIAKEISLEVIEVYRTHRIDSKKRTWRTKTNYC